MQVGEEEMNEEKEEKYGFKNLIETLNKHDKSINNLLEVLKKPLEVNYEDIDRVLLRLTDTLKAIITSLQSMDVLQSMNEIKFIGKKLNSIESSIKNIEENGIKKNIHLDFTCDGYELIKKKNYFIQEKEDCIKTNEDKDLIELLETLTKRQRECLIHKFGLFGQKKKNNAQIGKIYGITGARIASIILMAIRKLNHPIRCEKLKNITHKEFRESVIKKKYILSTVCI